MSVIEAPLDIDERLTRLGSRRGAAEAALVAQRAIIAEGPDSEAADAARREIARIKQEIEGIDDEIAGIKEHERRRAETKVAERRSAEVERRRADKRTLTKRQSERRELAQRRQKLARKLADLEVKAFTLDGEMLAGVSPYSQNPGDLRREVLGVGFNDSRELVARELASLGVQIPGLDQTTARSLVDQRDLLGWHELRSAKIDEVIEQILPDEED